LSLAMTQVAQGRGVVFDPSSEDNIVPIDEARYGFTNHAPDGGNRIVANDNLGIDTPEVPADAQRLVNPIPATVEVLVLDPGDVTGWTLRDASGVEHPIEAALHAGQQIRLQSGDAITLRYSSHSPKWHWRVIQ
jgi:hypothetical protein